MSRHGLRTTTMHEAEVFVVNCPGQAGPCISAASAVRGAYQVNPTLLQAGQGVAIKMKPVGHLPKTLYISPAFATWQAPFCAFFQRLIASTPGCKWKVAFADWGALVAITPRVHLIALIRSAEKDAAPFKNYTNGFVLETFINRIVVIDKQSSLSGL